MKDLRETNRRTVLKTIGAGVVGSAVLTGTASAHEPRPPEDYPPVFPTWGSSGNDNWEMLDPAQPQKSDHHAHRPIYHIGPSGGTHSPHLGPPHFPPLDNVVDTPSMNKGEYSAVWDVHFVVNSTNPDDFPESLVSFDDPTVSKVQAAIDNDSNVIDINAPVEFVCPVRPHLD